ncbi:LamG domain-containing protein [Psychrosphaera ytuae]|uniref:LamG domain-containing protein n=2 Tax=Psychrosphaera ytuae TaxID=2820710 RepID=A0A975DCM2_9GAMM|nr:LamG domain-containing protein [Psychrosphaera ytuae]QTH63190.1 LamG domain-containing protein [Psychrosphaera ytuae]
MPVVSKIKPLTLTVSSLLFASLPAVAGEGLENAQVTGVQFEYNDTTWAAKNLIDLDTRSRWLSRQQTNDINFLLDSTGDPACFAGFTLQNSRQTTRNIKEFALLATSDDSLANNFGTVGWQPIAANENPTDLLNYLSWAQGARLINFSYEHNANQWAAEHINDGDTSSRWLSRYGGNVLEFNVDADWDNNAGDPINIAEFEFLNYGNDDRSVREFQVEYTPNGIDWFRIETPGSQIGDPGYIFSRTYDGGSLDFVDSAFNATTWSGNNINDGDQNTRWLSRKGNNFLEFSFDPDKDGISGKDGDVNDLFSVNQIRLRNYGNADDRSVRLFQVAYKTPTITSWRKINVPGAVIGEPDYNFALWFHGARLSEVSDQLNTTSWGADNIHDGDQNTRWLAGDFSSRIGFQFDPEENGVFAETSDLFTFERFQIINYGADDRSIDEFQVEVTTATNPTWTPINVPGAAIGDANFNFALVNNGARLVAIDSEYNNSNWSAANLHDGSQKSRWLSLKNNNTLEFAFDLNRDNSVGGVDDEFSFDSFYIQNYGNDDRSIYEFQIQVKTADNNNWRAIRRPGAVVGDPNFNFALQANGGVLTQFDSQVNTTQWAAENLHDGDFTTRWLSNKMANTIDFGFDVDGDGSLSGANDSFELRRIFLQNYGNDDRSVKEFQIYVQTLADSNWQRIEVPGSGAGMPNYNFSLAGHGGTLVAIDSELNNTSWAAKNAHDGDFGTRWLSRNQVNTLEFSFDTNYDGNTGDTINLDTIRLVNYGNDDRSVATFEVEYLNSLGLWIPITQTDGTPVFTANIGFAEQTWVIDELTDVNGIRFKTLTNHGDPTYTGLSEISFSGKTVGPSSTFTAQMSGAGEYFELDPNNYPTGVTAVRFETLTNYGDRSYAGIRELKLLGPSTIETTIFTAQMNGNGETFTLDSDDIPQRVTGVRLNTISNHGDPSYIGAREFKLFGDAVNETTIFRAAMTSAIQRFELDSNDVVDNVTGVRLVTISNHGDPSYIGATEFEVLGPSITETKTFVGQMTASEQTFTLDTEDIPSDVTEFQLITINNYGDPSYIGMREFEVLGNGVTANYTFALPQSTGPHRIVLDSDDRISGAVGVRLKTINNHGDPSYIGLREFKLFGDAEIPNSPTPGAKYKDYIFKGSNTAALQTFEFDSLNAKYLRLHTMTNFDYQAYIEAAEVGLAVGNCATGQWHLDELSWAGTPDEVLDSSSSQLHGKAFGFGNGDGANTNATDPAIPGSPGTCRYGSFDGVDDYVEIPDSEGLDNTPQITLSAWFKADTLNQTNGTNARGLLSKRPSFSNNVSYGIFFLRNGGNELYIDIDRTNNRFKTNTKFNTGQWYHLAVVFDGTLPRDERVAVYVNGVLDGKFREDSTFIPDTVSNFYIGNLYTGLGELKVFDGAIDEVNVLPFAYSQSQVNKLMNQTRPCDAQVDHIRIEHSGSGVSCADHSVTLTACANADCSAIYTGSDISFTLQKNTGGTISDINTYVIDGTTGQLSGASFTDANVGTFAFTGTSAEVATVKCLNTSTGQENCDYNIGSSGFIVTAGNNNVTQSCAANSFTIQAVQASNDPTSGACVPAYAAGDYPLNFNFNYIDPNSSAVINTANANIEGIDHTAGQTGNNQNVTFDGNAQAVIDVDYREAGLISIVVNDANGVLTSTTAQLGFVPSQLTASWADGDANNIAGITEQVVIAGQCSDGTVLQNYRPSGDYQVQAARVAPTDAEIVNANPGVTPNDLETLTVANNTQINPNGNSENVNVVGSPNPQVLNVDYDEAASIQLSFTDNNYLGQSISTASPLSGSFGISHYTASLNTPALGATCGAASYVGQDINWATNPEVTLTAKNAIDGTIEFSDINGYWPFDLSAMTTEFVGNSYTESTSNVNNSVGINNDTMTALELNTTNVDGQRRYQVSNQLVRYNKSATPDVPFDANLDLQINASAFLDVNGVGIKTNAADPVYLPVQFLSITGTELRYGRLKTESTYGSELESLPWRAQIQVYQSSGEWRHNSDDNCSTLTENAVTIDGINRFDVETNPPRYTLDISNAQTFLESFSGVTEVTSNSGFITLPFASPGDKNIGSLNINVDLTSELPFLRWDWNDNASGVFNDSDGDGIDDSLDLTTPQTTITFGRYRGNERIIYKRER